MTTKPTPSDPGRVCRACLEGAEDWMCTCDFDEERGTEAARIKADAPIAGELEGFVPCPMCKQYSHSIGEDKLTAAFNHFQSMYAHPLRGHPMGHHFEEQTRDAAQVLATAIASLQADKVRLTKAVTKARDKFSFYEQCHRLKCTAEGDEKADRNRELADEMTAVLNPEQGEKP